MDLDAECLVIIDEKGKIISDQQLLALMVLMTLRHTKNAIVAVPVTAPGILEKMAQDYHGKIIRTKTDGRSLMHTAQLGEKKIHLAGRENGAFIFPHFQPSFDGMFAFARLLELMSQERTRLSELVRQIPHFHQHRAVVDCARLDKGRVMRSLIEESRNRPIDLIEGIKVYFDDAWVLAVPDPSEPCLHLVAEADSDERAQALVEEYATHIKGMAGEQEDAPAPRPERRRPSGNGAPTDKTVLPEEKAFHFWAPGRYLGVRATSFREFADTVTYIDLASLEYHMERGDFVSWFEYQLRNQGVATKIRTLHERSLRGEELRAELLKLVR